MKILYVRWIYLDTIEVPDDITSGEIEELLDDWEPLSGTFDDREWELKEKE